jgi:hypothetical protein
MTNNSTSSARLAPPIGGFQEIDGRRVLLAHRAERRRVTAADS